MPEEKQGNEVDKLLADEKSLDERKQTLIAGILKEKEAAIAAFDEKLAKLGYHANSKGKRSHHKKAAAPLTVSEKPKSKA